MGDALHVAHLLLAEPRNPFQVIEIEPEVVEYLEQPPDTDELNKILDLLALEPRELMRTNEKAYKELNLADESLSRDTLVQAMVDNPILIQRPIIIKGDKATLGRPPEKILDII